MKEYLFLIPAPGKNICSSLTNEATYSIMSIYPFCDSMISRLTEAQCVRTSQQRHGKQNLRVYLCAL